MAQHPLEPLSAEEFRRTAAIVRRERGVSDAYRFASIELREPRKAEVTAWKLGDPVARTSFATLWDGSEQKTYEAVVDLSGDAVFSFTHIPGVTPNFTVDEWHECDHAMKDNPEVRAALARRGLTDLSLVLIDVWSYGRSLMPRSIATAGWGGATSSTAPCPAATPTPTRSPASSSSWTCPRWSCWRSRTRASVSRLR
jgi:primary-amine oxidase